MIALSSAWRDGESAWLLLAGIGFALLVAFYWVLIVMARSIGKPRKAGRREVSETADAGRRESGDGEAERMSDNDKPTHRVLSHAERERETQLAERYAYVLHLDELRLVRAEYADLLEAGKLPPTARERLTLRGEVIHKRIQAMEEGRIRPRAAWLSRFNNDPTHAKRKLRWLPEMSDGW